MKAELLWKDNQGPNGNDEELVLHVLGLPPLVMGVVLWRPDDNEGRPYDARIVARYLGKAYGAMFSSKDKAKEFLVHALFLHEHSGFTPEVISGVFDGEAYVE